MGHDLDFHPHIILSQARNTNTCPQGLMVGHIPLKVTHHGSQGLVVDGDMVRVDPIDLGPSLATRILEISLHVLKSQVDLSIDLLFKLSSNRVPST